MKPQAYKRLYILIFCISFSAMLYAQIDDDTYYEDQSVFLDCEYAIIEDDPYRAGQLYLGILPIMIDASTANINLSIGTEIGYFFNNNWSLQASFRKSITEPISNPKVGNSFFFYNSYMAEGTAYQGVTPLIDSDIITSYTVYQKEKTINANVHLKRTFGAHYKTAIEARAIVQLKLRFGHQWFSSFFGSSAFGNAEYNTLSIKSLNPLIVPFDKARGGTMYAYDAINLGISFGKKTGLRVDVVDFGKRKSVLKTESYVDIIYAYNYRVDAMKAYSDGSYPFYAMCEVKEHNKFIPFGFRIGVKEINLRGLGWYFGFEAGMRPSLIHMKGNLYAMLKLGVNIGANLTKHE